MGDNECCLCGEFGTEQVDGGWYCDSCLEYLDTED